MHLFLILYCICSKKLKPIKLFFLGYDMMLSKVFLVPPVNQQQQLLKMNNRSVKVP